MAKWDEYAILETAKEEGYKKGIKLAKEEHVKKMLAIGKLSVADIASYNEVTEEYVQEVKKNMK